MYTNVFVSTLVTSYITEKSVVFVVGLAVVVFGVCLVVVVFGVFLVAVIVVVGTETNRNIKSDITVNV